MSNSIDEIKKIAMLSALDFNEEELASFSSEFEKILAFVDEIKATDTSDIEMNYTMHDLKVLREDKAKAGLSQEEVLANSPKTKKGAFCVPKMLEG